jgi:hypothetical protein
MPLARGISGSVNDVPSTTPRRWHGCRLSSHNRRTESAHHTITQDTDATTSDDKPETRQWRVPGDGVAGAGARVPVHNLFTSAPAVIRTLRFHLHYLVYEYFLVIPGLQGVCR